MKYFYTLLFVAIFLPFFSYAQSNYKPGLVVTLKGDTVHGFIDYKEWENSPADINFKSSLSAGVQQYTPGDIQYFQVEKFEAYQKFTGPISTDEVDVNRISRNRDTSFRTATVFLKVEQDGQFLTLYSYTDNLKKRYFITEKADNATAELIYKIYLVSDRDNNKTIVEDKYKGQLIYLAAKYKSTSDALQSTIENSNYDQDLVKIVGKINHSENQASHHVNKGTSFYAGISSGFTYLREPNANYADFNPQVSPVYSYLPRIAFGINAYTNPDVGRLIFRGEIAVQASNFKTSYKEYLNYSARSYYTVNQATLSIDPQVLYNIYNADRFKFFVEGGLSINFSKYSNINFYNGVYKTNATGYSIYATKWFSIPLSAGVELNKCIGIFVTYTVPTSQNDDTYYSTQLGVSYTFGHRK